MPRSTLDQLHVYQPGKPAAAVRRELGLGRVVKLASNEGPYGPFPSALEAIARQAPELNRYPERGPELRQALAERHGVDPSRVVIGNGADALVGDLSLAYLDPGDEIVTGWPSFVSYRLDAIKHAAEPVLVDLRDGSCDLDAMLERIGERTRLVYVCNPNNPTGGIVRRDRLARFLDQLPAGVLAVLDHAYHEYVTDPGYPDAVAEFADRDNVAVLRTFSKIYGLAGLRIGYAVVPAETGIALAKVGRPFATSELAHAAALASLDQPAEIARRRDLNTVGRAVIEQAFADAGVPTERAFANFVFARVGDAAGLAGRLEQEGIVIRPLASFGAPDAVRVTVGTPEENLLFADALARALQPA
jgi:histidinol-phosphate aminotransferase